MRGAGIGAFDVQGGDIRLAVGTDGDALAVAGFARNIGGNEDLFVPPLAGGVGGIMEFVIGANVSLGMEGDIEGGTINEMGGVAFVDGHRGPAVGVGRGQIIARSGADIGDFGPGPLAVDLDTVGEVRVVAAGHGGEMKLTVRAEAAEQSADGGIGEVSGDEFRLSPGRARAREVRDGGVPVRFEDVRIGGLVVEED